MQNWTIARWFICECRLGNLVWLSHRCFGCSHTCRCRQFAKFWVGKSWSWCSWRLLCSYCQLIYVTFSSLLHVHPRPSSNHDLAQISDFSTTPPKWYCYAFIAPILPQHWLGYYSFPSFCLSSTNFARNPPNSFSNWYCSWCWPDATSSWNSGVAWHRFVHIGMSHYSTLVAHTRPCLSCLSLHWSISSCPFAGEASSSWPSDQALASSFFLGMDFYSFGSPSCSETLALTSLIHL